jgi:hypothetical protein
MQLMSNKTESKLKSLVRPADFEKADRLERLYMHRLEPTKCKLNEREQKHFNRLRHTMLLLINPKAKPSHVVWLLTNDLGVKRTTAQTLVAQVPLVYPDLVEAARELEKADMVARLHQAIERCEGRDTVDDDATIARLSKEIREIRQWGKEDFGLQRGEVTIPEPRWTDDPSVLEDKGTDETENAEWEEMDEETDLETPKIDDDDEE